ncbi:MAG: hypothetical protein HYV28_09400 [Ignavibacteriales bacterium]|nr:hypothetical protein [Ignavibacteriales bacterium]
MCITKQVLIITAFFILLASHLLPQSWQSSRVYYNNNGSLVYTKDTANNRIPDFSFAGYKNGNSPLPDAANVVTISPIAGDNTEHIQDAIDQAGALSVNAQGIRGAVLLNAGVYRISGTLLLNYDGVILRGAGNGSDSLTNTILYGTGDTPHQRSIILAGGGTNSRWKEQVSGTKTNITNDTVFIGDTTITVANAANLNVGDNIVIYHPSTVTWLQAINYGGTHSNDPGAEPGIDVPWEAGDVDIIYNRYIKAKNGNTLTLDIPVCHHLIKSLSQSYIYKYARTNLKKNIGIENLRIDNDYSGELDENHVWQSIDLFQLEDSWVKNCTMLHFGQSGIRTCTASRVTIKKCTALDPVSIITGERRYNYQFYHASQMILVDSCHAANGRHHYMSNGISSTSGNVLHNCTSSGAYAPSEGHRMWTQALLYDNHKELDGPRAGYSDILLALYCRGYAGTSHGWSSVNSVAWNCDIANGSLVLQQPPLSQNYAIGCRGNTITGHTPVAPFDEPEGFIEGSNVSGLQPQSLYTAQLMQRLGGYTEPTAAPSQGSYQLTDSTALQLSWLNGNGQARIIIARQSGTANAVPVDNATYQANPVFGSGSLIGTDSYVVYKGMASTAAISGLLPGRIYTFSIFEWNGSPGFENYLSSTPLVLSVTTPALAYYSNGTGGGTWDSASSWKSGIIPDSLSLVIVKSGDSIRVVNSGTKVGSIQVASGGKLTASGSNIGSTNTKFVIVYGNNITNNGTLGTGSDGLSLKVADSLMITGSAPCKFAKVIPAGINAKVVFNADCALNYRAGATSSGGALILTDGGTAPNPVSKFTLVEIGQ